MTAQILDGKTLAAKIRQDLADKIAKTTSEDLPVLAVIRVGDNEASKIYVRNKQKAATEIGMGCEVIELSDSIGENALIEIIHELNDNPHTNGIIVQLPLPKHLNELTILSEIRPEKDVDGFTPYNTGLLSYNHPEGIISATPKGVLRLLNETGIDLSGKQALVIGRSNIVGKPLAMLLMHNNCTVTIAHSKTTDLPSLVKQADIVVAACGRAKMIKGEWLKKGAVVIDVGINRIEGKLCGDVDFESAKEVASFITPVPGGVGPMTIAMLLENTFEAFLRQQKEHHGHCVHHHAEDCHCNHSHDKNHHCCCHHH